MAVSFLKTTWALRILDQLDKNLVAERITNKNYMADGADSNIVKIFTPGDIPTKNYTRNTDLPAADLTTETTTQLNLDQQKAIDFFLDRVDIRQCPVNIQNAYMERAIYSLRDVVDQYILGLYVNVHANNTYTPTAAMSSSNVWNYFAEMQRRLTVSKVPFDSRYAVIDAWTQMLINTSIAGKASPLGDQVTENGSIGRYCGFEIFLSHNVPQTSENLFGTSSNETVHNLLFGHPIGITLAKQFPLEGIGALEVFVPEKRFGTEVKGLLVYGAKMCYSGLANGLLKAAE